MVVYRSDGELSSSRVIFLKIDSNAFNATVKIKPKSLIFINVYLQSQEKIAHWTEDERQTLKGTFTPVFCISMNINITVSIVYIFREHINFFLMYNSVFAALKHELIFAGIWPGNVWTQSSFAHRWNDIKMTTTRFWGESVPSDSFS